MPGQVNCRYKSLEKLSEGGMGVVKAPEVKGGTVAGQGRAQPVSVRPSARLPQGMHISIDFDLYELLQSCKSNEVRVPATEELLADCQRLFVFMGLPL